MTTLQTSVVSRVSSPAKAAAPSRWPAQLWRGFDCSLVLLALGALIADRVHLLREYLFKWTDHDQVLMWYGAREVLHGRWHEPCFYGQAYLSMLESYLAAPLVAWHVRPDMALPIVGVFLGVFPFLVLAAVAFRWRLYLAAIVALLIPLVLPFTYAIVSGIPRGFTDGLAVAAIAMGLLLPHYPLGRALPLDVEPKPKQWWRRAWKWCLRFVRPKQSLAFFFAGVASGFAVVANPNCGPLLLAVYVYAVLRQHQNWRFWLYTVLGLAPGAAWQWYIQDFYFTTHPDYRLHLRNEKYSWSSDLLTQLLPKAPDFFMHYLPTPNVCTVLLFIAGGLVATLTLLRQYRAAVAALVTTGFIYITLGYERVNLGTTSVYYPLSRMYLSLPVIAAFLVFFIDRGLVRCTILRWPLIGLLSPLLCWFKLATLRAFVDRTLWGGIVVRRVLILAVLPLAWWGCKLKYAEKERIFADSPKDTDVLVVRKVQTIYDTAAILRPMLKSEHADLILMCNNDVFLGYSLPTVLDCETLTTSYERRTWLLHAESEPRHQRILIYGAQEWVTGMMRSIDPNAKILSRSPMVISVAASQRSVIRIATDLSMNIRNFDPAREIVQPFRFRRSR